MSWVIDKVNFQPKGPYQKDDCVNDGCRNDSTTEAVPAEPYNAKFGTVTVRCCDDEKCRERAAILVLEWIGDK
ncbi:MAG: hypothetical protein HY226_01285 [Candidatus Vogelbacteria bacterium]|nr:hypothetical protein [Candidatus Vogelbacteria bacterium]